MATLGDIELAGEPAHRRLSEIQHLEQLLDIRMLRMRPLCHVAFELGDTLNKFAHLDRLGYGDEAPDVPPTPAFDWIVPADASRAVVVDLPGHEAVVAGLALAARGWGPVPLFNGNVHPAGVVDVESIARYLWRGSGLLRRLDPGPQATPAFLLDSRRMTALRPSGPGRVDNRWIVLPQDLPSGVFLQSRGITLAPTEFPA